ncbi:hypothetical protein DTV46_17200 [Salmonella enterica subsp. salamae]|nr:hypothetical protein [Salmonella enterica subsp. salamae]HAB1304923.1 hypothetical protein [Salmonella enterica subsp. enterica serovar Enteritidis]HAB2893747.1 hypothetical protein [Salmonella enterica subsp. enterica serovar Enteritidis]
MAVKLEVIIYTNENGKVLTMTTGSCSECATGNEFHVAKRLQTVIREALKNDYNGVTLFSEGVVPCAHNTH